MPDDLPVPRRRVVTAIGAGWLALGGSLAGGLWATGRFIHSNQPDQSDPEIDVGPFEQYASMEKGQVRGVSASSGIWIVRQPNNQMVALDATCTHLGCRTAWAGDNNRFRCPCHGSSFAVDGTNLDGPAPRGQLDRLAVCVKNGRLVVNRSRRFRKERGEWENADSFVIMTEGEPG